MKWAIPFSTNQMRQCPLAVLAVQMKATLTSGPSRPQPHTRPDLFFFASKIPLFSVSLFEGLVPIWVMGGHNGEGISGAWQHSHFTCFMFEFQWQKVNIHEWEVTESAQTPSGSFDLSSKAKLSNKSEYTIACDMAAVLTWWIMSTGLLISPFHTEISQHYCSEACSLYPLSIHTEQHLDIIKNNSISVMFHKP